VWHLLKYTTCGGAFALLLCHGDLHLREYVSSGEKKMRLSYDIGKTVRVDVERVVSYGVVAIEVLIPDTPVFVLLLCSLFKL
jgi:hypothetical protein